MISVGQLYLWFQIQQNEEAAPVNGYHQARIRRSPPWCDQEQQIHQNQGEFPALP